MKYVFTRDKLDSGAQCSSVGTLKHILFQIDISIIYCGNIVTFENSSYRNCSHQHFDTVSEIVPCFLFCDVLWLTVVMKMKSLSSVPSGWTVNIHFYSKYSLWFVKIVQNMGKLVMSKSTIFYVNCSHLIVIFLSNR